MFGRFNFKLPKQEPLFEYKPAGYQTCPVCEGSGERQGLPEMADNCDTCNGHGIINRATGDPPMAQHETWTSVEDKYPKFTGEYLVATNGASAQLKGVDIMYCDNKGRWFKHGENFTGFVTHWKHLPEPPQQ